MKKDEAMAARLARVDEIEAEIDPSLRRRGRIIADVVTLAVVTPLSIAFDLHVTHPFGMLTLMGVAIALNHVVPLVTERRLRAERERLLTEAEVSRSETDGGAV